MWRDPFDLSQTVDPGRPRGAPLTIDNRSVNLLRAFCIILEHFFQIFLNIFSQIEHEKGAEPVQNTETAPTIYY
jgi:hypothetical protein